MTKYYPPPPELAPGSTVWAYLRDSGGEKQDRSIEQQQEVITDYCQKHGLNLDRVFADVHLSGRTDEREELQYMAELTTRPEDRPNGIIFWSSARIGRNQIDTQYYRAVLRKRGIVLHTLIDDIPQNRYQIVFEAVIDIANQDKSDQTSAEAKRGLAWIFSTYGVIPGTPPRGFMRVPIETVSRDGIRRTLHRWQPDPETAPLVRRAFEMRAAGRSLAEINAATNLFGSLNSYRTFWSNKLYIGIMAFGDQVNETYCQPIVDSAIWQKCQEISQKFTQHRHMQSERDHPRRTSSSYLLSGLPRCARCGSPMWGQTSPQRNGDRLEAYRCTQAHRRRDCDLPRIPAHALEQAAIDTLADALSDPQIYIPICRSVEKQQRTWHADQTAKQRELENRLRNLKRAAQNLADAIGKMGYSTTLADQLAANERQQTDLDRQLRQARTATPKNPPTRTDAQIAATGRYLSQRLRAAPREEQREILHGLISAIHVNRDGKNIYGIIEIYLDEEDSSSTPPQNPPNTNNTKTVGITNAPVGAPRFTHSIKFETPFRRKPRSK